MADYDVKIQIKTLVGGLEDLKNLTAHMRALVSEAAKEVKDPTASIGKGASQTAALVDKAAQKTTAFSKAVDALQKKTLIAPYTLAQLKQASNGLHGLETASKTTGSAIERLIGWIKKLNSNKVLPDAPAQFKKTQLSIDSLSGALKGLTAGLGAGMLGKQLISMMGVWTDFESRVRLASGGMTDAGSVMERLGEIADRAYSPLEQTAESFLSNATTLNSLNISMETQLDLADALTSALVVSGAKGHQFDLVIGSINRSMAIGKLAGQELNNVLKYGGAVAETLAKHLKVPVSELRNLGAQGKLTAEVVTEALVGSLDELVAKADSMPATVGDSFVKLKNRVLQFAGALNETTQVESGLVKIIVEAGEAVNWLTDLLKDSDSWLSVVIDGYKAFYTALGKIIGTVIVTIYAAVEQAVVMISTLIKVATALIKRDKGGITEALNGLEQESKRIAETLKGSLEDVFSMPDPTEINSKLKGVGTAASGASKEVRELSDAMAVLAAGGEAPESLAQAVEHLQSLTKETEDAKRATQELTLARSEAAMAMITAAAEQARQAGEVDAYKQLTAQVELYKKMLDETRRMEIDAARATAQRLEELKALGVEASLVDLAPALKSLESSQKSFSDSMNAMIAEAKKAKEAINKALAESGLSAGDRARLESEYKAHTQRIFDLEQALADGRDKLAVEWLAEQKIRQEEEVKGVKLTSEAKKKIYADAVAVYVKGEFERLRTAKEANIAVADNTVTHMGQVIKAFEATAEAGTVAGQAILLAMGAVQGAWKDSADEQREELKRLIEEQKKKIAELQKNLASGFSGGGGGRRGGAGASPDATKDAAAQAAEIKRMAEFEAEQIEKAMIKAVRSGEMAYSDYIKKRMEAAKSLADLEVQQAEEALARISEARGKASETDIIKAQNDLTIAQARAAETMEQSYTEAFTAIAEEHARLQATMQSQQEMVRLQMEAGILSQAQGQRQLNEITRQYLPILEQIAAIFGEEIAKLEEMGFDVTGLKQKFEELRLTNEQVKNTLSQTAAAINGVFENSFSTFLSDLSQDIKNVTELFRNFVKTVLQGLAQIASQQIASSLFSAMGRAGGGIGGFLSGLLQYAEGGRVSGPGTDTSDNILSWLSPGEFVLRARAVRKLVNTYGYGFLDFVNNFDRLPKTMFPGYAEGGLIGGSGNALALASNIGPGQTISQLENFIKLDINTSFDKEGFLKTVVESPQLKKKIMSTNYREAKTLSNILRGSR